MFKRYVLINFVLKDGAVEYSSGQGYILGPFESLKPYSEIRKDCIESAHFDGKESYNMNYFSINSIVYLKKRDYLSLFGKTKGAN